MDKRLNDIQILLKSGDDQGISFHETKKKLLSLGFSESEISGAIYSVSYDGKPNTKPIENSMTQIYADNPELAQKVGAHILETQVDRERDKVIALSAASQFAPDIHSKSKYSFQLFEELGLPYFRTLAALLIIGFLVGKYNLPDIVSSVAVITVALWVGYTAYNRYSKR